MFFIKQTLKKVKNNFLKLGVLFVLLILYMALGSLLFLYIEQCYDVVKKELSSLEKSYIDLCDNITKLNHTMYNITDTSGVITHMKIICLRMDPVKTMVVCEINFKNFCKWFKLSCSICLTIGQCYLRIVYLYISVLYI